MNRETKEIQLSNKKSKNYIQRLLHCKEIVYISHYNLEKTHQYNLKYNFNSKKPFFWEWKAIYKNSKKEDIFAFRQSHSFKNLEEAEKWLKWMLNKNKY